MIAHICAFDFGALADRVIWMPSHVSVSSIGKVPHSGGGCVTPIMWRANRLADALAKIAAAATRLPARLLNQFGTAGTLVRHQCALLGVVTKAANNFSCVQIGEDGSSKVTIRRDSTAERPQFSRRSSRATDDGPAAQPPRLISDAPAPVHAVTISTSPAVSSPQGSSGDTGVSQRDTRRRFAASVQSFKRKAEERERLDSLVAAKRLRPSSAPPAALRMAELRARVAARADQ